MVFAWFLIGCGSTPEPPGDAANARRAPAADTISVVDLRARAMPPGAPNSAAFMTIRNEGAPTKLVGAEASISDTVELHTHMHDGGMMKMRRVDAIPLPRGETRLEPGGLHVMFIGLTGPLEVGRSFPLTLRFEDGSTTTVTVPVQTIEPPHH